jgi:hypothetical protein
LVRGGVERGVENRNLPLSCSCVWVLVRPSLRVLVKVSNPSLRKRRLVRWRMGRSMILRRRRPRGRRIIIIRMRRSMILRRRRPRGRRIIIVGSMVAISPMLVRT